MAKRKRDLAEEPISKSKRAFSLSQIHVEIVTGSYEKVLSGITASIPRELVSGNEPNSGDSKVKATNGDRSSVTFRDTFLFDAHTSSVRTLAISPSSQSSSTDDPKRILATGGSDSRIQLFQLSTTPPSFVSDDSSAHGLLPNPKPVSSATSSNRSLGTLTTHDTSVNVVLFPHSSRTKLLSACAGNLLAITSTRTWTTLSLMKSPNPTHPGRPSGDTAVATGSGSTLPMGVSALSIHPSNKLLLSVHRGERCLRLWNLVTGKKAGVMVFEKKLLKEVGEATGTGRIGWSKGEGRSVAWSPKGDDFVVGFERGVVVFNGRECVPKSVIMPEPATKVHDIKYLDSRSKSSMSLLMIATEAGELLFYDTKEENAKLLGVMAPDGNFGRVKAFETIHLGAYDAALEGKVITVTAGSDGALRVWVFSIDELIRGSEYKGDARKRKVGTLLGTVQTGRRVLCMGAFPLGLQLREEEESAWKKDESDESENEDAEDSDLEQNSLDGNEDEEEEEFNGLDD
jgi:protein MAK11